MRRLTNGCIFLSMGAIREDFKSPGILLAAKKLDYLMMSEEERRGYDDYLAFYFKHIDFGCLSLMKEYLIDLNFQSCFVSIY